MKPYYYVCQQSQAPVVRYPTLGRAQAEAERLAEQRPGAQFEILKAVAVSAVCGPASTFFTGGEGQEAEKLTHPAPAKRPARMRVKRSKHFSEDELPSYA